MAKLSHSESRKLYSWWWDSHISPKNSKWLKENLTDMDGKVKSMIKLIEEDADSFARRAEMYYKKRPELMKLVEEFYRAYRALAERYTHTAGELHHAQCTLAKKFSDQVPFELTEDFPSDQDREPRTREINPQMCSFFTADGVSASHGARIGKDPRWENEEEKDLHDIRDLKAALVNMEGEKDSVFGQYHMCLKKLSEIEEELSITQRDYAVLDEESIMAELEMQTLKEVLIQVEAEKIAALVKHKEYMEKISNLEALLSIAQEDLNVLEKREGEVQALKDDIGRSRLENNIILDRYKLSLGKISNLDQIISKLEDEAMLLQMKTKRADAEIVDLKNTISELKKDKEASVFQYNSCLEMVNRLAEKFSVCEVNVACLENEVMVRIEELRAAKESNKLLDESNQSLREEVDNLAKNIEVKDLELSEKQQDLEKLHARLHDERLCYLRIEETLQSIQNLNSESEEKRRALEMELKDVIQKLMELEVCKNGLEVEIQQVRDENCDLNRTNLSSSAVIENLQNEIDRLRKMKQMLEKEVSVQMNLSESLQQEISSLREQIDEINSRYEDLQGQLKDAGLSPEFAGSSLKNMVDENFRLKNMCNDSEKEKAVLSKKLENIEVILSKQALSERFLLDLKQDLEASSKNSKELADKCQSLRGENASLVTEKACLFSQLQVVTENMHRLLEKNAVLENFLFVAKIELEGLKEKSKGLEEICSLLKNERSNLLNEKGNLVLKFEIVEGKLKSLEKKLTVLEEENARLEKEKETVNSKVDGLEQENESKNKHDEELEMALKSQFELSILKKFMKEMEEKNQSLLIECQKHVEASKMAEKVISELESESLEQQVETEVLLDEIERLRLEIYKVFRAVETGPDRVSDREIEDDKAFMHLILGNIEKMKSFISKYEEDKQQLCVENLVLVTFLQQLESKGIEIESKKIYFENECEIMAKNLSIVEKEKDKVLEMSRQLNSDVIRGQSLELEISTLRGQLDLQKTENVVLTDAVRKLESEMRKNREYSVQMKKEIIGLEESLSQTGAKLESAETVNSSLKAQIQESLNDKEDEILESEFCIFLNGIEEKLITEQKLRSDLQDKNDELKLWESEAEAFYFDLQVSSVHEVMLQDKVQELALMCKDLENERFSKMVESEQMKGTIFSMEKKIGELKSKLNGQDELGFREASGLSVRSISKKVIEDQSFINLRNLQERVKAVRKLMEETNSPVLQVKPSPTNEIELQRRRSFGREKNVIGRKKRVSSRGTPKLQRIKNKASKVWNGMLMKDITLDRVELCETSEFVRNIVKMDTPSTDSDLEKEYLQISARRSNVETECKRFEERLALNSKKLEILQTTVKDLRAKMEINIDSEAIKEQLLEAEETIRHLWETNVRLANIIQEPHCQDAILSKKLQKAMEMACKGSERIDLLQLELQKIQCILVKLEHENGKTVKNKFFKSKTVILRDFMYNRQRKSGKRKKSCMCGCLKPSTSFNGRSL